MSSGYGRIFIRDAKNSKNGEKIEKFNCFKINNFFLSNYIMKRVKANQNLKNIFLRNVAVNLPQD